MDPIIDGVFGKFAQADKALCGFLWQRIRLKIQCRGFVLKPESHPLARFTQELRRIAVADIVIHFANAI